MLRQGEKESFSLSLHVRVSKTGEGKSEETSLGERITQCLLQSVVIVWCIAARAKSENKYSSSTLIPEHLSISW